MALFMLGRNGLISSPQCARICTTSRDPTITIKIPEYENVGISIVTKIGIYQELISDEISDRRKTLKGNASAVQ